MKLSELQKEGEKFNEARWVDYGAGMRVLVRPLGNPEYETAVSKALRVPGRRRGVQVEDEQVNKVIKAAISKHVLVGWSGLEGDDGKPVEYDPETALRLFNENHKFFSTIREIAADLQAGSLVEEEETEGN